MSTYDILIQKGRQEGRQEGHQEGRQEEASEKNRSSTLSLLKNTDFDDEKIATIVGVSMDYVQSLRFELEK